MKTQKILLDTDIGGDIDDAVCLAYLLREPQCALLGVTTVCGESEKRAAGALARWPHRLFDRGDAPGLFRGLFVMNGCFGEAPLPEPWYNWNAWADPLAAAAVFHPELLRFVRGFVRVETARRDRMAETAFTPDAGGNVEIARSVEKKNFYALLSSTLNK